MQEPGLDFGLVGTDRSGALASQRMPEVSEQVKCLHASSNPGNNSEDEGEGGTDEREEGMQTTGNPKKKKQQPDQRGAVYFEKLPDTQLPFAQ